MDPSHQDMALPHILVGKDGVELWTTAANIMNKQLRTAEKGSPLLW